MGRHTTGKNAILEAWLQTGLPMPTQSQLYAAMAVACHESGYGTGWTGAMAGSNNWGAVQAGPPPCVDGYSILWKDSHPDGTEYERCFRAFATPAEGALNTLKTLFINHNRSTVFEAARRGNMRAFAEAMHDSSYYEGRGVTVQERVAGYAKGLWFCYREAIKETGEPECFNLDTDFGVPTPEPIVLPFIGMVAGGLTAQELRNRLFVASAGGLLGVAAYEVYRMLAGK